ncbi:MAG TPA: trypsin-like peptidase domain-containing protein [Geothrix sp.]|nr:trypsin-like peptidase domain-containing protein [Geothrix sp.]
MIRSRHTFLLGLAASLALPLAAQTPAPPTEEATIQRFRAHAAPRPVAPRAPLSAEERNTVRRFKAAKPSVVYVSAIAPGLDLRTHDITKIPQGQGTGFVWDEWGHIVTNHHIITVDEQGKRLGDVDEVEITLADGKTYKGRVIGYSFAYDIAVLQAFAPLPAMRPIPIGSSGNLQVGQSVMAIGNPFGLDHSLSKGVISALGREIGTDYSTRITDAIQTDAAVNPGNSGGPLLDSSGRLIGMNTAIVGQTGGSVGVGFAIPVDTLNHVVPRLIARGFLVPVRMGFDTLNAAVALKTFGIQRGLVVSQVDPDTPAGRAGIRPLKLDGQGGILALGDILLAYQGRLIESNGQLMAMLELEPPADEVVFDVLREGQVVKVTLQLKAAAKAPPASI